MNKIYARLVHGCIYSDLAHLKRITQRNFRNYSTSFDLKYFIFLAFDIYSQGIQRLEGVQLKKISSYLIVLVGVSDFTNDNFHLQFFNMIRPCIIHVWIFVKINLTLQM